MSLMQKDWFLRQLDLLTEALARIAGKRVQGHPAGALDDLRQTAGELLGPDLDLAEAMDAASAADVLGDPERVELYARYLAEVADLYDAMGRQPRAAEERERALELLEIRQGQSGSVRPESLELMKRLQQGR